MALFLFLTLLILSVHSCSGGDDPEQEGQLPVGAPPSLEGEIAERQVVRLTDQESEELNIQTFTVKEHIHRFDLETAGTVFPSPDHFSIVSTPLPGRIISMGVREGEPVGKGEVIFRIESLELGVMVSEYLQAIAEENYHRSRFTRITELSEKQISSASELDRARSDLERASTITRASFGKLRASGISEKEISEFRNQEDIEPVLNIRSPINGTFDRRSVDLGEQVSAYEELGTVIDNTHVMIRGYLSPEDGRSVRAGNRVLVTRREAMEPGIPAYISTISPGLDEANRSAIINIYMEVPGDWPRPGENVRLEVEATAEVPLMAIPMNALTYDGNDPVVFVRLDEKSWEERAIRVREMRDTSAILLSGLREGEVLAVSQVFSLKALSRINLIAEE